MPMTPDGNVNGSTAAIHSATRHIVNIIANWVKIFIKYTPIVYDFLYTNLVCFQFTMFLQFCQ